MSHPNQAEQEAEDAIFAGLLHLPAREPTPLEKEFNEMVSAAIAQNWPPKGGLPNE